MPTSLQATTSSQIKSDVSLTVPLMLDKIVVLDQIIIIGVNDMVAEVIVVVKNTKSVLISPDRVNYLTIDQR